ncbi:MAG: DUF1592 domain-containing protein [Pseudomonadales bacterium]|nr:DUF1592 domain-containing protein [Pseudomonadales bacterium]
MLDAQQSEHPNPGHEGLARLNRAEYINVIRDLLAFDASDIATTLLPADVSEDGFDNLAETLSVSPTLIEAYVGVAMRISREAVGDRTMIPTQVQYPAPSGSQTSHREGLPLGTRGGMLVTHNFPLDAEYEIRVSGQGASGIFNNQAFCSGPGIVLTLNEKPLDVENPDRFQIWIPAGPQTIGAALVDDKRCTGVNDFYDDYSLGGSIRQIEINGPFEVSGPGDTPSRRAIFTCYPQEATEEKSCARAILQHLASLAFRQPLPADYPKIDTLMQFFDMGSSEGDFETGIQYAISRLLIDPQFLYQVEAQPTDVEPGDIYRISQLELASRLSFFLWSSIPDNELLALADSGTLADPDVLVAQVGRMLNDERAHALVENFAGQWLMLRELEAALPQDRAFNDSLKQSFREETELLFMDMIQEDRSLLHLLNADYTWLDEELARHYGFPDIRGDYMRKVALPADSPRRGLLGQGSILTATSVANRTSPVLRGAWIVENILGVPRPVPPPGVETDLSQGSIPEGKVANTLRERLEMHRVNPTCAACHQIMDPLGLALENFDLIGRWRDKEEGHPINTSSHLIDGTPITSPVDMRNALLARGDTVATSITEKLLTYALGRTLKPYDMPAVRKIVNATAAENYRFSNVILRIVQSLPFQYKVAVDTPQHPPADR